jgi:hypothetical protein
MPLVLHNIDLAQEAQAVGAADRLIRQHYGFTEEELDFIIHYDIKYRMGGDTGDEE